MHAFFDFIVLAIAVVLAVMGARRGLIREIFRFVAMLVGFVVSFLFFPDLQSALSFMMANQSVVGAIAFLLIYLACYLAITGVGLLLRKFTEGIMLGWLDNTLGGVLGILKALIITWALCLSISSRPEAKVQAEFGKSYVYRTYKALPDGLNLDGLEATRNSIRGKKPDKKIGEDNDDNAIFEKFLNAIDLDSTAKGDKKKQDKK